MLYLNVNDDDISGGIFYGDDDDNSSGSRKTIAGVGDRKGITWRPATSN